MHMTKKGLVAVTRKMKRQKIVNRSATKKGHEYGVKIGDALYRKFKRAQRNFSKKNKGARPDSIELIRHREKYPLKIDPTKSNHQRNLERKEARDAAKAKI
jgi:hypothetical protein